MARSGARDGGPEHLFLRALGPCVLEGDGAPLPIGGPKSRAVLLRLALAEGRMVTTDLLIADIWGDDAPPTVVGTLQGYLSRLRTALGDPDRLRREGPGYVLDLDEDQVDFRRFLALVDRARAARDRPAEVLDLVERATALWRGGALVDVADAEWASPSAVRLEERRLEATDARFDALLDLGRHALAVSEIGAMVADHPLHERFTAQLMTALYRSGRQADALRAYERTRRILVDDAGLDPSTELVALADAILAHDPALAPDVPAVAPSPAAPTPTGPTPATPSTAAAGGPVAQPSLPPAVRRHGERPFVGRAEALSVVEAAWAEVAAGHRGVVVVEGEAGVGKSRLAARAAADAHAAGGIVLWGRSAEESILPYAPMVEALRTVVDDAPPEVRERLIGSRSGLSSLLPFVDGSLAPPPTRGPDDDRGDGGDGLERYRMFEAVSDLLAVESEAAPILLVLDDLQWVDAPTLRMLQHVLGHQRPGRLLVLATVRAPSAENVALGTFFGDLQRDHRLTRVVLDGLAADEVDALLRANGRDATPAEVDDIVAATQGNPFFVTELADRGDHGDVPDSVRDVLAARLARLGSEATHVLTIAAVAGADVPFHVLAQASGLGSDAVIEALDAAHEAGLLAEEDAIGTAVFRHALIRQVVADRVTPRRRRAIHLEVADAYAATGGSDLDVAHHLFEAGPMVPPARAATAADAGAREALAVAAYETTATWAARALALAVPTDHAVRARALVLVAAAHRALGERPEARDAAAEAIVAARAAGDPVVFAEAAEEVAVVHAGLGFDFGTKDSDVRALVAEALEGLTGEASAPAQALARAEANGHHALVSTAHLAVRMSIWRVDTLEQRLDADRRAVAAAERAGQPSLLLNALLYQATDLTEAGRIDEASAALARLRSLAGRLRSPVYDAFVDFFDAQQALTRGEYARSAELADRGLLTGLDSHGTNAELAWSGQMFIRAWDQGEIATMTGLLDDAVARAPGATIFRLARALSLVAGGRHEEVRSDLPDLVTSAWLEVNRDSLWLAIGGLVAEIARGLADAAAAQVVVDELLPYRGRIALTGLGRASLGPVDRFVGVAAATAGDRDLAVDALRAAVDQARLTRAIAHEARALHDLSLVLAGGADEAERRAGEEAAETARALAGPIGLVLGVIGAAPA